MISLILAVVLFPPAALALISNNAVPGDRTYPIKRGLEDIIYSVASVTPTTKAWFSAARSDRRFEELSQLFSQGKSTSNTLNELINQTQTTVLDSKNIANANQRRQLIFTLEDQVKKYEQGLQKISNSQTQREITVPAPTPIQSGQTIHPQPSVQPSIQPSDQNLSAIADQLERQRREIEEANRRLEDLKRQIDEERKRAEREIAALSNPTPTPSPFSTPTLTPRPTPTSTPIPTPTPTPTPKPVSGIHAANDANEKSIVTVTSTPAASLTPMPTPGI